MTLFRGTFIDTPRSPFQGHHLRADQDAALSLSLVMLVVSIGVLVGLRDHWLGTP